MGSIFNQKGLSERKWKILILSTGFLSTLWLLIRVIPKPSRAHYPCVQAAAPWASSFVLYMLSLGAAVFGFKQARVHFFKQRYTYAILFVITGIMVAFSVILFNGSELRASRNLKSSNGIYLAEKPNTPIGKGVGIFPGRVVWAHNPDATNENCDPRRFGHTWYQNENNNQEVIDSMLAKSLRSITGTGSAITAWDSIFAFHNNTRNKGKVNYKKGENIFIKTNATSTWASNINKDDLSDVNNKNYGISETSPQLVLSLIRQLVNVVGVAQEDIYVGDPMKHIYKEIYDIWHSEFPNVHYLDQDNYPNRLQVRNTEKAKIYYSDRGSVLRTGTFQDATAGDPVTMDHLYDIFYEMEYMLNIPTLKAHRRAGVTMFAKNHFGSHTRKNAVHLHGGLVAPEETNAWRSGYGLYRVQVDIMGHELLGKKNLVYIMDALYTAEHEVMQPSKWYMPPFNNDWMSSIFVSFDPVAIESVGYDFLKTEYTGEHGRNNCAQLYGTDDYLHQAADSSNWPDNITYDPENDGSLIGSLGVHEHWNNSIEKKYSRNLGNSIGIELVNLNDIVSKIHHLNTPNSISMDIRMYPNPASDYLNVDFSGLYKGKVYLSISDLSGKIVFQEDYIKSNYEYNKVISTNQIKTGTYIVTIKTGNITENQTIIIL